MMLHDDAVIFAAERLEGGLSGVEVLQALREHEVFDVLEALVQATELIQSTGGSVDLFSGRACTYQRPDGSER